MYKSSKNKQNTKLTPRAHFRFRDNCNMTKKKGISQLRYFGYFIFLELMFFKETFGADWGQVLSNKRELVFYHGNQRIWVEPAGLCDYRTAS